MVTKIYFLVLALLVVGCATPPSTSSSGPAVLNASNVEAQKSGVYRRPASLEKSGVPEVSVLSSYSYQGPYEINPKGYDRKKAKIYLPTQYQESSDWPLVILLHGFSGTAVDQDNYLTLRFRASRRGFILLTPEGTITPNGTLAPDGTDLGGNQFWNATDFCCDFAKTGVDDVKYLKDLISYVKTHYKVNSKKVYLFGHSNGGFMANRLACELKDTFAGIASLAGGSMKLLADCQSPGLVSFLQIHAENDKTVLYKGATEYASGVETVGHWLQRNSCSTEVKRPKDQDYLFLIRGNDTKIQEWKKCAPGKEVSLWSIGAFEARGHSPHVPLFNLNFTESVLDFLLRQELKP